MGLRIDENAAQENLSLVKRYFCESPNASDEEAVMMALVVASQMAKSLQDGRKTAEKYFGPNLGVSDQEAAWSAIAVIDVIAPQICRRSNLPIPTTAQPAKPLPYPTTPSKQHL